MNNKSCWKFLDSVRQSCKFASLSAVAVLAILVPAPARADVPAWLRSAASSSIPKYSDETQAVLLYDETTIVVKDASEVHAIHRRVYRILHPGGRDRGVFDVSFDKDTKVLNMRAWSLP